MACAVSGWAFRRSCLRVAVATLIWLPVEALLINFESAHGAAGLASHSDPIRTPPPLRLYRQVWAAAGRAPARPLQLVGWGGGSWGVEARGARFGKGWPWDGD